MSNIDFEPGEIVELKSGSPKMTVDSIEGTLVWCIWFVNNEPKGENFGKHLLKKVEAKG